MNLSAAGDLPVADLFLAMLLLGITGGIGMGKSEAAAILEKHRFPVVDTDVVAREVSARGSVALQEIAETFGPGMLDETGGLRRARLADLVFGDVSDRRRLEAILHPKIASAWRQQVEEWRARGESIAAVVIPLLYEKDYGGEFDAVVCVACSGKTQHRRLRERCWTETQINARNAAQLPVSEKISRATFVVWTEGSISCHSRQWDQILADVAPTICSRV